MRYDFSCGVRRLHKRQRSNSRNFFHSIASSGRSFASRFRDSENDTRLVETKIPFPRWAFVFCIDATPSSDRH